MANTTTTLKSFVQIADGFYHRRACFMKGYVLDIGTHMALCRLTNGRYLVLDTVKLSEHDKADVNALTDSGNLIDGVIATHPFHTVAFQDFYANFPNLKYYGTPRHLRNLPTIPWTGDVSNADVRKLWEPYGVYMRIPDGSEFVNPAEDNHFSNVFVYHKPSKTVFNDDTILFLKVSRLSPISWFVNQGIMFHPTLTTIGLYPTKEAPLEFKCWMTDMLNDWEFEHLCTAHNSNIIGGAHAAVKSLLQKISPVLDNLSAKNGAQEQQSSEQKSARG